MNRFFPPELAAGAEPEPGIEMSTAANGITVATAHMPHLQTASVGLWVGAGSRQERPEEHGLAHFLEHMAFKGTASRSALQIAEEIEAVGGHLNAHTAQESTAYYARILKDDMPLAVDLLADIVDNAAYDPGELERERGVILQEIAQATDTPDDFVFDKFLEAALGGSLGRPILGTEVSVRSFTSRNFHDFVAEHYRPPSLVVAAAGAVDHARLVDLVESNFAARAPVERHPAEPVRIEGADWRQKKRLEQAHLILGFEGVALGLPDYFTAQVFSAVLGGGMSSRLFQELREKRGLCYSTFSFSWSFSDIGLFGLYAGTSGADLGEAAKRALGELGKMTSGVSEAEVARAKSQLKAGLLMSLESCSSRAEQLARQIAVYGRPLSVHELTAAVDVVSASDVMRFAERLVSGAPLCLAALGPLSKLPTRAALAAEIGARG